MAAVQKFEKSRIQALVKRGMFAVASPMKLVGAVWASENGSRWQFSQESGSKP